MDMTWATVDTNGVAPNLPRAVRGQLLALKRKVEEEESLTGRPSAPDIMMRLEALRNEIENLEARIRNNREIWIHAGWVCSTVEDAKLLVFFKGRFRLTCATAYLSWQDKDDAKMKTIRQMLKSRRINIESYTVKCEGSSSVEGG